MSTGPLARRLGLGDAVVLGLGSMIGAGIFASFAPAAAAAGGGLLLGLAIAGVIAYLNASASAQLAAQYPTSGGTYVYGRERLGEWPGFLAGWAFVIGKTASLAAMALTFAAYAVPGPWQKPVAVAAVVALAAVNYRGVTLPDPPLLARAGWALAFTAVAAAIALAGLALSDAATPAAVVRNVVFHAGLALLLARTDGRVLWLPGVLLTLMAMLFGQGSAGREVATWAFALDPTVEPSHLGITGVVYLLGLAAVTWPRRDRLPGRPVSPRTPPGARP